MLLQLLDQPKHSEADPDGESEERTHVGIVSFARLQRGLVEIHHDGNAREDEQEAHDECILGVFFYMEKEAEDAEHEREKEETIVGWLFVHIIGEKMAVAKGDGIKRRDSGK